MQPQDIESLSFKIIEEEAGSHGFCPEQWAVVRRMIHTSADFDYLQSVRFRAHAISDGLAAIRSGKTIFTDTEMARSGLRKGDLSAFGCKTTCLIGDPDVARQAKANTGTRAAAAVDAALESLDGAIYVVGNAPTALLQLIALIRRGVTKPALVVGLPVGFVNAAESKADLLTIEQPCITNVGRKGGSNVAASVINALVILAKG